MAFNNFQQPMGMGGVPPWLQGMLQNQSRAPTAAPMATTPFQAIGAGGAAPAPLDPRPRQQEGQGENPMLKFGMGLLGDPEKRDKIMNGLLGRTPEPAGTQTAGAPIAQGMMPPPAAVTPEATAPLAPGVGVSTNPLAQFQNWLGAFNLFGG